MISLAPKLTPRVLPSTTAAPLPDRTIKIHGRTHITGIELSPWKKSNYFFGSTDEICANCIIDLDSNEYVTLFRYRSGIHGLFNGLGQSDLLYW